MQITAIEDQKNNKNRKSIFIDGEYRFSLDVEDYLKLRLEEGMDISEEELERLLNVSSVAKCKKYILNILSKKSYTEKEYRNKMREKGYLGNVAEQVILFLKEYHYINDEQYAKCYINDSVNIKKKGAKLIRQELIHKGVDVEIINNLLEDIDTDDALLSLVEKKARQLNVTDRKEIKKLFDCCVRRGHSYDDIKRTVNRFIELDE